MYKKLNSPAEGLERDAQGHRTGFKCMIKLRKRMSQEGFDRYDTRSKLKIRPVVWVYYSSSRAIGLVNGIPLPIMKDDKTMGNWMINNFLMANGETFAIHGYTAGKTKTKVKLTKALALIEVYDVDQGKFAVKKQGRLNRYWFRLSKKKERMRGDMI
jgi:hypothetical protein